MATLKTATFPRDQSGKQLLGKVQSALTNLTGFRAPKDANYAVAPTKLDADRDLLKSNYKTIWQQCTIEYDPKQAGAEVAPGARKMKIGPFFLDPTTTVMDMEKVILHEYLHLVIDISSSDTGIQHGQINQIIKYNLKYPGPPNPANPAE